MNPVLDGSLLTSRHEVNSPGHTPVRRTHDRPSLGPESIKYLKDPPLPDDQSRKRKGRQTDDKSDDKSAEKRDRKSAKQQHPTGNHKNDAQIRRKKLTRFEKGRSSI